MKRYQLYSHYQDENAQSLGPEHAYEHLKDALIIADQLAQNPITYGSVEVWDTKKNEFIYQGK